MKIKWGIISTANIGTQQVIPAMQSGELCDIIAIASRNLESATNAAKELGIAKAYGSYEELLEDPEIQAIYNPLPNHLHTEWTIKAMQAGKHVLCEKPIGLNAADAQHLIDETNHYPDIKVMEAFMYRFHPQWTTVRTWIQEGKIGELKNVQSYFSYFNNNPDNIRNMPDIGGGALMDIGCYCISFARYIFGSLPTRALGHIERDPTMKTDRLTSGILDFENGTSSFMCSTQLANYQRVQIFGTTGRIELEIPVNAPTDKETRILLHTNNGTEEKTFPRCNQYTLQCDAFSKAILNDTPSPTPLEDALENMQVIDAIIESADNSSWVKL